MKDATDTAFISLFKDAFEKCFGLKLYPVSETECKHFSNKIFEETGLVIGAKSLKNYAAYILNTIDAKQEKPSVATLDTLARFVLNAPYTDEVKRKEKEAHYPYWFQYKNSTATRKEEDDELVIPDEQNNIPKQSKKWAGFFGVIVIIISVVYLIVHFFTTKLSGHFEEDFHTVQEDSLRKHGWFLQSKDDLWWGKRNQLPAHLTLYTLRGDNWADSVNTPGIKNLLLRKLTSDCFVTEIQLDNFVPGHKWQQAGILLLEDTMFSGKSLRLSIAFNDFFGGYSKPKEIIVQAISSVGKNFNNPEEILHLTAFTIEPGQEALVAKNLQKSALKIEKNGNHFRFLYATGQAGNFAFKEALSKDLDIQPKFIGIFALQGFVDEPSYIPAHFKFFSLSSISCKN